MKDKSNMGILRRTTGIPRYKIGFYAFIAIASSAVVVLTLVL